MNEKSTILLTDPFLRIGIIVIAAFVLVMSVCLYCYFGAVGRINNDEKLSQRIVGTWSLGVKSNKDDPSVIEESDEDIISFTSEGSYTAHGTQIDESNIVYFVKWEGRWQITNSVLTTPTSKTSGFAREWHPKVFLSKCKIVKINNTEFDCIAPYYSLNTNGPVYYFKRVN